MIHFKEIKMEEEIIKAMDTLEEKQLIAIIEKYKNLGVSKKETEAILSKIFLQYRKEGKEEKEDFILDILDLVSGWCSKGKEIWKD